MLKRNFILKKCFLKYIYLYAKNKDLLLQIIILPSLSKTLPKVTTPLKEK